MESDFDDGFFSIEQLLIEEGLHQNSTARDTVTAAADGLVTKLKPQLKLHQRRAVVDKLLELLDGETMPRGGLSKIARDIGVHRSTITRIFHDLQRQKQRGGLFDVTSKKVGKVGRKPKEYSDEWLQSVPLHLRTTVRSFAGALKVPHITVYRLLKKGQLRSHTSSNHPRVSEMHKLQRMQWALSHIIPATANSKATFVDMHNVIHIDEKWFYLNPDMRRFYLLPAEDDPYRCTQSRRYKIKAMFMGVTSRPIYDQEGQQIHDGKFGIFPFVYKQRAKKNSKNRAAGTLETKAVQNVSKEVIREMLINTIIPSIMQKWPTRLAKDIYIQWDNARPHSIKSDDIYFREAATKDGFNIQLVFQPPQSPDLNVLDLGLFRAIQSLQYQSFPKDLDDLIVKVQQAYDDFDPHMIKYTWLQLQWVMVEILKVKGGNNYKPPHHGKARLERMGLLPDNVEVEQQVIDEAVEYLNQRLVDVGEMVDDYGGQMEVDAD